MAMMRSSDGKKWFYERQLRKFPSHNFTTFNEPLYATVAFGKGGGPAGADVWVFGGNTRNAAGEFGVTIFYSLDDGDSLLDATGAFGPAFPRAFSWDGKIWLAIGRTDVVQDSVRFLWRSTNASHWSPHTSNLPLDDRGPGCSIAFVNEKWFAIQGGGLFLSPDGSNWTRVSTLPLFSTSAPPDPYPGSGGPSAFAISPFEEFWGVGGLSFKGPNPEPVFYYSLDGGVSWQNTSNYFPFGKPYVSTQEVVSMAYGAGTFVLLGNAEVWVGFFWESAFLFLTSVS